MMVAVSSSPSWIYISLLFSMLANLVYPAVSSLVSKVRVAYVGGCTCALLDCEQHMLQVVAEDQQGEALGALNGIKALVRYS